MNAWNDFWAKKKSKKRVLRFEIFIREGEVVVFFRWRKGRDRESFKLGRK